jgi:hypothetical protein
MDAVHCLWNAVDGSGDVGLPMQDGLLLLPRVPIGSLEGSQVALLCCEARGNGGDLLALSHNVDGVDGLRVPGDVLLWDLLPEEALEPTLSCVSSATKSKRGPLRATHKCSWSAVWL